MYGISKVFLSFPKLNYPSLFRCATIAARHALPIWEAHAAKQPNPWIYFSDAGYDHEVDKDVPRKVIEKSEQIIAHNSYQPDIINDHEKELRYLTGQFHTRAIIWEELTDIPDNVEQSYCAVYNLAKMAPLQHHHHSQQVEGAKLVVLQAASAVAMDEKDGPNELSDKSKLEKFVKEWEEQCLKTPFEYENKLM